MLIAHKIAVNYIDSYLKTYKQGFRIKMNPVILNVKIINHVIHLPDKQFLKF